MLCRARTAEQPIRQHLFWETHLHFATDTTIPHNSKPSSINHQPQLRCLVIVPRSKVFVIVIVFVQQRLSFRSSFIVNRSTLIVTISDYLKITPFQFGFTRCKITMIAFYFTRLHELSELILKFASFTRRYLNSLVRVKVVGWGQT